MTIIPLCVLLHLLFYDDAVEVISYVFKKFYRHHHIQSKYWYNYKLLIATTGGDNYDNIGTRVITNPIFDSLGIDSTIDYNINSKNLLQELCQYLFNGSNPFYEWYPFYDDDDDEKEKEKEKEEEMKEEKYKYMLRIVFGSEKIINYTHYLITSKEDNNQCKNNTSSLPPIKTTITTTATLFNSKNSSYSIIPNDDYVLTNANKKIQELIASMNMFNYIKTLKQYEIMVNSWLSLRLNKNNTARLITKFDLITQQVRNKRVAILIDIENVPDFRKYFYIHRNGYISFTSPPVPKLVIAPSIGSNFIDDDSVRNNRMVAGDFTYSRSGGISSGSDVNYKSDQSTNNGSNEVMGDELSGRVNKDSLQNYLESSAVSQINYKNIMKRNPYLRNNLEGTNLVDTSVEDDNDISAIRYDDYDEHCDRVLLNSDLNDEDILILAYAHTKSMLSNWANRVTTDSRKNAADIVIMLDVGALQAAKNLEVVMIITQDKFGESVESCFRQDWNIHFSQLQQHHHQQQQQQYQHFDDPPTTTTEAPLPTAASIAAPTYTALTTIDDRRSSQTMEIPMVVKVLPTCQACTLAIGRIVGKS